MVEELEELKEENANIMKKIQIPSPSKYQTLHQTVGHTDQSLLNATDIELKEQSYAEYNNYLEGIENEFVKRSPEKRRQNSTFIQAKMRPFENILSQDLKKKNKKKE